MKRSSAISMVASVVCMALAAVPLARANVWDEETRMVMIKVLVGEAGYSLVPDHPAIIAVLHKRKELPAWKNKPIVDLARAYSAAVREGMPVNANRARISCGRTHNVFLGPRMPVRVRPRAIPINGVIPARQAY